MGIRFDHIVNGKVALKPANDASAVDEKQYSAVDSARVDRIARHQSSRKGRTR
jgi:hypothetical protein